LIPIEFRKIQVRNPAKIYIAPYAKLATPLIPKVRLKPMARSASMELLIKPYTSVPKSIEKPQKK
jgi:hypothetical protein